MDQEKERMEAMREHHKERIEERTKRLLRVPIIRDSVTKRSKEKFDDSFVEKKLFA